MTSLKYKFFLAFLWMAPLSSSIWAQSTDSPSGTDSPSASTGLNADLTQSIETFSREVSGGQTALDQAADQLIAQGASETELMAWEDRNAPAFELQWERMNLLSAKQSFLPMDYVLEIRIPEDAASEMEDFLVGRANLQNLYAEVHNDLILQNSQAMTPESAAILEITQQEIFVQQNALALQKQTTLAIKLGDEASHETWDMPPPLTFPRDATPQIIAYLTVRNEIEQGQVAVHNRFCAGSQAQLETAVAQWNEQHADLLRKGNQLAQALAQTNSDQE